MKKDNSVWVLLGVMILLVVMISGVLYWRPKATKNIVKISDDKPTSGEMTKRIVKVWRSNLNEVELEPEAGLGDNFVPIDSRYDMVMIPQTGSGNGGWFRVDYDSPHWSTAFCAGDAISYGKDNQGKNIFFNFGVRACGLKTKIN